MLMNETPFAYSDKPVAVGEPRERQPGVVDSLLHPMAVLVRQVLTRPGRQQLGLMLIDDEENILQALHAGVRIHSLYVSGDLRLSAELRHRLPPDTAIYEVAKRTCKKLFENDRLTRIFALALIPDTLPLDNLLSVQGDIVAAEDLSIAGNIGAIARTAAAFAVGGLILLNAEPVDIYDRRVIRASRGHIFSLPVLAATTGELIHFCKRNRLPIMAMAAHAQRSVQEGAALPGRVVIALGSEKNGCSPALLDAATLRVQIPTHARVDSLNVSTAAGIMLYNRLWFNRPEARR